MLIIINDIFGQPLVFPLTALCAIQVGWDTISGEKVWTVRVRLGNGEYWEPVLRTVDGEVARDFVEDVASRIRSCVRAEVLCDLRMAQSEWKRWAGDRIIDASQQGGAQ